LALGSKDIIQIKISYGKSGLTSSMIHRNLIFFNLELLELPTFSKVSCGLHKQQKWVIGGKWVMVGKLDYGKIIGWVPPA
jgi:hypothetical protein